jgi:hypothetical protein
MKHKDKPDGQLMAELLALIVRSNTPAFVQVLAGNVELVHAYVQRAKPWIDAIVEQRLADTVSASSTKEKQS